MGFLMRIGRLITSVFLILSVAAMVISPTEVCAELILVGEFDATTDLTSPCDVESVLASTLENMGCDVVRRALADVIPDVVVNGEYWKSGENLFATITAVDSVTGQTLYGQHAFIPEGEAACKKSAMAVAGSIAMPPVPERKRAIFDTVTGMKFIFVPGGSFTVNYKGYRKKVWVDSFYIGKYEVTQEEWTKIMGTNPSKFKESPENPVENISWNEASEFVRRFNEATTLKASLPSEMQWEYAARSRGRNWRWAGTNQNENICDFSWCVGNADGKTHEVGVKRANGLGVYDMSGNVWEWCKDLYSPQSAGEPEYPEERKYRVIKGGAWTTGYGSLMTTAREGSDPISRSSDNGLRLIVRIPTE